MENEEITTPKQEFQLPEPNPKTQAEHQREVRLYIWLPLALGVLILVGAALALGLTGTGDFAIWSQISTIFMIFPAMILGLIVLVILSGLAYAVGYLLRFLPPYARLTQDAIDQVKHQIETGADISAKPVIQIRSFIAMINTLLGRK